MIIPLKMQRVFVNINFPEPKGASQLVCHLFTGPESCTLKPNRLLSDPLRTKSYSHNLGTTVYRPILLPKTDKVCAFLVNHILQTKTGIMMLIQFSERQ